MLDGEQLTEIWLPHDHGSWNSMGLTSASTPDAPVVRVGQWGVTPLRQYRVTKRDIIQEQVSSEDYLSNAATSYDKHLRSGEICRLVSSPASTAFVNAIDERGRARSLVSKIEFLAATQNVVQTTDPEFANCTHFLDVDLLIVGYGDSQATFAIAPDRVWLASPGAPFAITRHHLIQFTDVLDERGAPTGSGDYVNVTRKRP